MPQRDLQEKIKWPVTTMLGCVIDNPDFTGKIVTSFNSGGVVGVEVTNIQTKPPKITERLKSFLERIFK